MQKFYFISDTHFNHANIIKYTKRPFKTVDEMNSVLIKNWNDKVDNHDTVFILGDFAFGHPERIFPLLNGRKVVILGNHDHEKEMLKCERKGLIEYEGLTHHITTTVGNFYMVHKPDLSWEPKTDKSIIGEDIMLFGHIHNSLRPEDIEVYKKKNCYNVGVDVIGFAPASIDEVITYNKEFKERNGL